MAKTIQQILTEVIDDSGIEVNIRSYSGRSMYGRQCVGIVGTFTDCQTLIAECIKAMMQDLFDTAMDGASEDEAYDMNETYQTNVDRLLAFSQDNMGLDVVIYWSRLEWVESEEDETE